MELKTKKISKEQLEEMVELMKHGLPYKEIGERFGCSAGYCRGIAHKLNMSRAEVVPWTRGEENLLKNLHHYNKQDLEHLRKEFFPNRSKSALRDKLEELRKRNDVRGKY